jgi:hypothetical protein
MTGDTLTLQSCGGDLGRLGMLVVTAVDGNPTLVPIFTAAFDSSSVLELSGSVPAGLGVSTVRLQSFGFVPSGALAASNTSTVSFP